MFDNDLQHYYLRARWYNPANGRFNKIDPFAGNNRDPQSLHKYLYAHCNPVNATDPSGNFAIPMVVVKIAIVAVLLTIGLCFFTNIRAKTEVVVVFIEPSKDSMRPLILAKRSEIVAQFFNIVPIQIFDASMPVGRKRGYNRSQRIYRVQVVWSDKMGAIGKTKGSKIALRGANLERDIKTYEAQYPQLTQDEREYVAANVFMHELVHAIFNRNRLRSFLQHEGTGLMKGPPFSLKTFSVSESKDGLMPFSSTTEKRLKSAVGTRF